jgi:hypothetical protein
MEGLMIEAVTTEGITAEAVTTEGIMAEAVTTEGLAAAAVPNFTMIQLDLLMLDDRNNPPTCDSMYAENNEMVE